MSFAIEGTGSVTNAAVMSAGDPRQSTLSAVRHAHGLASVFTLPVEYGLRPLFGTRYFMPITWLLGLGLANLVNFVCLLVSLGKYRAFLSPEPIGSTVVFIGFLGLNLFHARRIWRLMNNMALEYDSELPGPALSLFTRLPKANDCLILRCVYEPAIVWLGAIAAALVHLINPFAALFYVVCGVALSLKGFCTWYLAWNHWRDIADRVNRAPMVEQFAMGVGTTPATPHATPLAPAVASPVPVSPTAFPPSRLPREAEMLLAQFNS